MATARSKEARTEETQRLGGERVDTSGKRWHLRSLRTNEATYKERPHCEWCGLFIDVFGYFDPGDGLPPHPPHYGREQNDERALHEDCFERRDAHLAYMLDTSPERDDGHRDSQGKLQSD